MVNYVADDPRRRVGRAAQGRRVVEPESGERDYGKFGWIMDPDGNRIELWESLPRKESASLREAFSWRTMVR